jgi:ribosomal protein S18 acetylase RimI-like enzyme
MHLSYRSETPADEPFIRRLMIEVLTDQLAASSWPDAVRDPLLDAQFQVRLQGFRQSTGHRPGVIVLMQGEPVGWYVAADFDDEIHLVNLAVLKEHRGHGTGSAVLGKLAAASDRSGKCLRLSVAENNQRAAELYARFGFRRTGGDGVHYFMERPPQSESSRSAIITIESSCINTPEP